VSRNARPAPLHFVVGPVFTAIGLDAHHSVQVIAHDRKRIDRNRKTPRQQSEPILNPLAAMVEVALGMRVVAAKPGASHAARYAVVDADDGGRNEL